MRRRRIYGLRTGAILCSLVLATVVSAQQPASSGAAGSAPAPAAASETSRPSSAASQTPAATANPLAARIKVASGTHIPLVLHNAISTRSAKPGDPVYFETIFPVMVDGKVVIPAGSYVSGEITESKRPGRIKGRGELMMKFTEMILPNGYMVNLSAMPNGAGTGGGESVNNEGQ